MSEWILFLRDPTVIGGKFSLSSMIASGPAQKLKIMTTPHTCYCDEGGLQVQQVVDQGSRASGISDRGHRYRCVGSYSAFHKDTVVNDVDTTAPSRKITNPGQKGPSSYRTKPLLTASLLHGNVGDYQATYSYIPNLQSPTNDIWGADTFDVYVTTLKLLPTQTTLLARA
jgi:hypothetical protein